MLKQTVDALCRRIFGKSSEQPDPAQLELFEPPKKAPAADPADPGPAAEDPEIRRQRRGKPVDLAKIPKDDPAVYDMLCRADTVGTFQVESRAQMATLPIMRPKCFYDVAIEVAIIRPGPIVGDLVHPYLNRRCGREKVDYIHPACEPILKRTLGVTLFQEQVVRIAMDVAGFTGAEADELRRAMAFKRSDAKMEQATTKLRARMTERGIAPDVQEKIAHSIGSFALYGFPESHAISSSH